ncbi:MAG: winged helix-turn-helix domain-containing protein [Chthoniobacterales bacterium]
MASTTDDEQEKKLSIGAITLDAARRHVEVGGKPLRLTSVEFKLLSLLMRRQGRVQERDRLLNEVWGYEGVIDTRTVDTHVRRLRKKLGKAANAIETVRGFGYRIRNSPSAFGCGKLGRARESEPNR